MAGCYVMQVCETGHVPTTRSWHGACTRGSDKMLVFGGVDYAGRVLNDTLMLDLGVSPPRWEKMKVGVCKSCVGNSQFAPIRKPSEFARAHPTSQRAVQICELGALQRSAALALCVGTSQFAPIRNHL